MNECQLDAVIVLKVMRYKMPPFTSDLGVRQLHRLETDLEGTEDKTNIIDGDYHRTVSFLWRKKMNWINEF